MERIMTLLSFGIDINFRFVKGIPLLTYVTLPSGMELKGYYAPKMSDEDVEEEEDEIVPERSNKKRKLVDEDEMNQVAVAVN